MSNPGLARSCPSAGRLLNEGVNSACDWWALGVVLVELLTGVPPFTDGNGDDMRTYRNILAAKIMWDDAQFKAVSSG